MIDSIPYTLEECTKAIRDLTKSIERANELNDVSGKEIYCKSIVRLCKEIAQLDEPEPIEHDPWCHSLIKGLDCTCVADLD